MVKRRGGGFFTTTYSPPGGMAVTEINWKNIILLILLIVVLGVIIGVSVWAGTRPKDQEGPSAPASGGKVGPPMSQLPGRINIAEVAQAPSAGQGIIYFSQAEEAGTVCDTCEAVFDINLTYVGGTPQHEPDHRIVTTPALNGVARFDYSVFAPSPSTPGQDVRTNTSPPTQVQIEVTARSQVPGTGKRGPPTTFSKTIPYVA
jgi:hypothetical protein